MPVYLLSVAGVGLLVTNLIEVTAIAWWIIALLILSPLIFMSVFAIGAFIAMMVGIFFMWLAERRQRRWITKR